jgi:hypothetical protein
MLEAGTCSILFLCVNWVGFWIEYCLCISIFKGQKSTFFPNKPTQLSWIKTCVCQKKNIYVISRHI